MGRNNHYLMMSLKRIRDTSLGLEPDALCHLNGGSAVQDAIVSHNGWQYAGFWRDAGSKAGVRNLVLARRAVDSETWAELVFEDYDQREDDGHNAVSVGLCHGDGTIHLSFDLHDTPMVYRLSTVDLISNPSKAAWSCNSFTPVMNVLPGLDDEKYKDRFKVVTYPRFLNLPKPRGWLALEYRIGMSGLGDCFLFLYDGSGSRKWTERGMYLKGVKNNPYLNGIDVAAEGSLHVSWCYRDFVPATLEQARQQAGPNGPENNHDVLYAWSPCEEDGSGPGLRWFASNGKPVGISGTSPITPSCSDIMAAKVDKYTGGALNQEAQTVDSEGGVHVLNREIVDGRHSWYHYYLSRSARRTGGTFARARLDADLPAFVSARGKIVALPRHKLIVCALPLARDVILLASPISDGDFDWKVAATIPDAGSFEWSKDRHQPNVIRGMEVLLDRQRGLVDSIVSIMVGQSDGKQHRKVLKVMEFEPSA